MKQILFEQPSIEDIEQVVRNVVCEELANFKESFPQNEEKSFMTRKQAGELLGVSLVTLHRWEQIGRLIPLRVGTRVRYRKSDVDKLFELKS